MGVMMRGFRFVIQATACLKKMGRKEKGLKEDFGWALERSGSWAVASRKISFSDIYGKKKICLLKVSMDFGLQNTSRNFPDDLFSKTVLSWKTIVEVEFQMLARFNFSAFNLRAVEYFI